MVCYILLFAYRIEESESGLAELQIGLGSGPSESNLLPMTSLALHAREFTYDVSDVLHTTQHEEHVYVIMRVTNQAGNVTEEAVQVLNDLTPPEVGEVTVVTSASLGYHSDRQVCQTTEDFMEVVIGGLEDPESGIHRSVKGKASYERFC